MEAANQTPAQKVAASHNRNLPATKIMKKWGSNAAFARAIKKAPTTTYRWLENGHIPPEHLPDIVKIAAREGIAIGPEDCVDMRIFKVKPKAVEA